MLKDRVKELMIQNKIESVWISVSVHTNTFIVYNYNINVKNIVTSEHTCKLKDYNDIIDKFFSKHTRINEITVKNDELVLLSNRPITYTPVSDTSSDNIDVSMICADGFDGITLDSMLLSLLKYGACNTFNISICQDITNTLLIQYRNKCKNNVTETKQITFTNKVFSKIIDEHFYTDIHCDLILPVFLNNNSIEYITLHAVE